MDNFKDVFVQSRSNWDCWREGEVCSYPSDRLRLFFFFFGAVGSSDFGMDDVLANVKEVSFLNWSYS